MNLKKRIVTVIRGWLPKEPNLPTDKLKRAEAKNKLTKPKPRWWKPYWMILVIVTIALGAVIPFFTCPFGKSRNRTASCPFRHRLRILYSC
jgi:hypothetical protein